MKNFFVLFPVLVCAAALFAQQPDYNGMTLTTGRAASLGVEASTAFAWDLENNSTGLQTRAGLQLIFDLFPATDKSTPVPEDENAPAVRLMLKDAAFTWWNTYAASGGNYEQDNFNRWQAKPLILTFDSFYADLVWSNYFFRVASSTTLMQTNTVSLRSIFDEVMDVGDRFYYRENQALWRTDRYNIQNFPILGTRLERDFLDVDFSDSISGILAGGMEFEKFGLTLKAASFANGLQNEHNAWAFGADAEIVPVDNFKIDLTGFAAINYDKTTVGENPISAGVLLEYQIPLSEELILVPYAGFDFLRNMIAETNEWEAGIGLFLYTRGYDERTSFRVLDYDNVIPIGLSLGVSLNNDTNTNIMLSWFDPAGRDSLIPNFGGFLQLEIGIIPESEGQEQVFDFAILAQFEYSINQKITPYIRAGYKPEIRSGVKHDNMIITAALGLYMTPVHFFSFDLWYSMNPILTVDELVTNKGLLSAVFTIRM